MALIETPPGQDLTDALVERVRAASHAGTPLRIVGGDTKRFYGRAGRGRDARRWPVITASCVTTRPSSCSPRAAARRSPTSRRCSPGTGNDCRSSRRRFGAVGHARRHGRGWDSPVRRGLRAGPVRDYVLGARLLTGDGRVLKFGGEVMKNVAGYDVVAPARRVARHPRRAARRVAQGAAGRAVAPARCGGASTRSARSTCSARPRSAACRSPASFWQRRRTVRAPGRFRGGPRRRRAGDRRRRCWTSRQPPRFWHSVREQTPPVLHRGAPALATHAAGDGGGRCAGPGRSGRVRMERRAGLDHRMRSDRRSTGHRAARGRSCHPLPSRRHGSRRRQRSLRAAAGAAARPASRSEARLRSGRHPEPGPDVRGPLRLRRMHARPADSTRRLAARTGGTRPAAQLRALRLLPARLPDLPHHRQRTRQPARSHLPDQGDARAWRRDRDRPHPPRPLPDLPRLRDRLPVRRAVRPARRPRSRTDRTPATLATRRSARGSSALRWPSVATRRALFTPLVRVGQALRPALPAALKAMVPAQARDRTATRDALAWPAARHARRMAVLEGCVQPGLAPQINAAAARVLDRLGISLVAARDVGCCGALEHHLGRTGAALDQVRRNVAASARLLDGGCEAIVSTASGCGTFAKDYGHVLRHADAVDRSGLQRGWAPRRATSAKSSIRRRSKRGRRGQEGQERVARADPRRLAGALLAAARAAIVDGGQGRGAAACRRLRTRADARPDAVLRFGGYVLDPAAGTRARAARAQARLAARRPAGR